MAIKFSSDFSDGILSIVTEGFDEGFEDARSYSKSVMNKAKEYNCLKVICDERNLEYRLSMVETFKLAEFLAESVPFDARIAIIADVKFKDVIEFWETVSVNRGVSVKAFHDLDSAKKWIDE